MFAINSRYTSRDYEYCELVVHGNITLFRRKMNDGDNWEVRRDTGEWHSEWILNEIVTELFNSVPDNYSWLKGA